jgi:hypothetical protein
MGRRFRRPSGISFGRLRGPGGRLGRWRLGSFRRTIRRRAPRFGCWCPRPTRLASGGSHMPRLRHSTRARGHDRVAYLRPGVDRYRFRSRTHHPDCRSGMWRRDGLPQRSVIKRLARGRMLGQILLARGERGWSRRWCNTGHHLPLHQLRRRSRRRTSANGRGHQGFSGRSDRWSCHPRRCDSGHVRRWYGPADFPDRPATDKGRLRHRHHRIGRSHVYELLVVNRMLHVDGVVHVVDDCNVAYAGVVNVHVRK